MDKKNTMLLTVIAIATLLVAVVGATFAYFSVTASNNATATNVQGSATSTGSAITLETTTASLLIKLDATHMAQDKAPITYYAPSATADPTGAPIADDGTIALNKGIYTMASALVADGDTHYKCTFGYTISGTITTPVGDNSTNDIKVRISADAGILDASNPGYNAAGYVEYTLAELLAGDKEITGVFADLVPGVAQTLTIQSTVTNTESTQDDLAGNSYTITATPKAGTGTTGFSCVAI